MCLCVCPSVCEHVAVGMWAAVAPGSFIWGLHIAQEVWGWNSPSGVHGADIVYCRNNQEMKAP